jgi:hypothetical protein
MDTKKFANRGVERNKKPLSNIVYDIEVVDVKSMRDGGIGYEQYLFKNVGYLVLHWCYEHSLKHDHNLNWHGFITVDELKKRIGDKQYAKFCEGKRRFIIQRRVDGHNIKKNEKNRNNTR